MQRFNLADTSRFVSAVLLVLVPAAGIGLIVSWTDPRWIWLRDPLQTLCIASTLATILWRLAAARQLRHLVIIAAVEAGEDPLRSQVTRALNDAYRALTLSRSWRERFEAFLDAGFDPASAEQRNVLDQLLGLGNGRGVDPDDYLVVRLTRRPDSPETA